jgi:hypothetical protein
MKFYFLIPKSLKPFFETELEEYRKCLSKGELDLAWNHLERAHVIGQRYPFAHSCVHWQMLKFGIRIKNSKEVLGQLPRLVFGGVKSFVGTVPVGNPGGSNVPPLKPYPIDDEIQEIFDKAGLSY